MFRTDENKIPNTNLNDDFPIFLSKSPRRSFSNFFKEHGKIVAVFITDFTGYFFNSGVGC
jgi:hypothetical protein